MGLINSFSQIHFFFSALLNLGSEISHERPSFKQSSNTYGQTRTIRLCRLRDEYPSICRLSNVITLLQEAVSQKSRVNCFRCQPTYKGSSPIFRSYGTNCDLLFLSVRQDSPRACVQTEPGLWWMILCILWPRDDCLFLQDIRENDLGCAAARPPLLVEKSTVGCSGWIWEWHLVILLKVYPFPCPSSALDLRGYSSWAIICDA